VVQAILTCRWASDFSIAHNNARRHKMLFQHLSFFFRRALRTTGLLCLVALSERGRVSLARGQLQVHVCTWLHGTELHGRHQRVWQEPVQTRYLQEYSRILQVSRTTRLNTPPRLHWARIFIALQKRLHDRGQSSEHFDRNSGAFFFLIECLEAWILKIPLHDYQWNAAFEVLEEPGFLIISVSQCLREEIIWLVDINATNRIFFFKYEVSR